MLYLMLKNTHIRCLCAVGLSTLLGACGGGGSTQVASNDQLSVTGPDVSAAFFDPERLLTVSIEIDEQDYEQLRYEGRSFGDLRSGCIDGFEYTNFSATVTVDGQRLEQVGIRKKGFLGSLSGSRPSLKLSFDAHVPARHLESMDRMTLNNNRQDGSATHQCITYQLFRQAGLPAPRCNFARVSVNGQDLGYYSNVESINEQFVNRNFANGGGNLYEGQGGAFAPLRKERFQLKTNERVNDRTDLDQVVNALSADDANFPGLIEQLIDVDQYIDFWAMEIVMGHWDGGTSNVNNYFTYRDPDDGRFTFIPWGTDGAMQISGGLNGNEGPIWRYALLAERFFNLPLYREQLFARVNALLDSVFNEEAINAEITRIQTLTESNPMAVETTRQFVDGQANRIRTAIDEASFDPGVPLIDGQVTCNPERSTLSGQFDESTATFSLLEPDGTEIVVTGAVNRAPSGSGILGATNPLAESFSVIGAIDGRVQLLIFNIEQPEFKVGEAPLHGVATTILLVDLAGGAIRFASDGNITLTEAGAPGEPFSGTFSALLAQ